MEKTDDAVQKVSNLDFTSATTYSGRDDHIPDRWKEEIGEPIFLDGDPITDEEIIQSFVDAGILSDERIQELIDAGVLYYEEDEEDN